MSGWPDEPVDDISLKPYITKSRVLYSRWSCIMGNHFVVHLCIVILFQTNFTYVSYLGVSHMKALSRMFLWWPNLDSDVQDKVRNCSVCQSNRPSPPPVPLQPWKWPSQPWSQLHLDFAGPFITHVLMLIDAHSKWLYL